MKKDKKNLIIYILITLGVLIGFSCSNYLFGSNTDWLNQHTAFPEYFRKSFYTTHNFFPNFIFNLGSGQNIYNFSYYGLYNPLIILSYLFPMIKMQTYIIGVMLLVTLITTIMIYYFIKEKYDIKIAFISGLLYLLAAPILFNAHRHIMFVSYMPFLLLGLFGIEKYNKNSNNFILLVVSISLMILTSYYYSIGGILALFLYYLYTAKKDKKNFLKFISIIILSVLLTSFFLFPTAAALLKGRVKSHHQISYLTLFLPNININEVLYSYYSPGLTSIFLFAIIAFIISKKKKEKFLGITMLILSFFPISSYILNGFLYPRTKSLIPFLPLAIYMIAHFLSDICNKKVNTNLLVKIVLAVSIILFMLDCKYLIFYLDIILTILSILFYNKYNKKYFIFIPLIVISAVNCLSANTKENYVRKDYKKVEFKVKDYYRTNNLVDELHSGNDTTNYTTSIYSSVYNPNYYHLYTKVFNMPFAHRNKLMTLNQNELLFQKFMGVKYIITTKDNFIDYEEVAKKSKYKLLKNDDVFALGYGSNNLMSYEEFSKLKYPYSAEALMHYVVVDAKLKNTTFKSNLKEYHPTYSYTTKKLDIKSGKTYMINSNDGKLNIKLDSPLKNQLLFINFNMDYQQVCSITEKNNDQTITINGITNKLTCKGYEYDNKNYNFSYVISEKNLTELKIKFSKGRYKISNIKMYTLDNTTLKDIKHDDLVINKMENDCLKGHINMRNDGYFVLSIPYDKGFNITMDGKKVAYEKTNVDLIGFKMPKGKHKIIVKYNSPLLHFGEVISLISLMVLIIFTRHKTPKKQNNRLKNTKI